MNMFEVPKTPAGGVELLNNQLLRENKNNFYGIRDVEELAENIKANGILQNLVVRLLPDNTYEVQTGHRRLAAVRLLVELGELPADTCLPCRVIEEDDADVLALQLISTNQFRELNDYEKTQQARRAVEAVRNLRARGLTEQAGVDLTGRERDAVAKLTGMSSSSLAKLQAIDNNLKDENLRTAYKNGEIATRTAYELSRKDEEEQARAGERVAAGEKVMLADAQKGEYPEWLPEAVLDLAEYARCVSKEKEGEETAKGMADAVGKQYFNKGGPDMADCGCFPDRVAFRYEWETVTMTWAKYIKYLRVVQKAPGICESCLCRKCKEHLPGGSCADCDTNCSVRRMFKLDESTKRKECYKLECLDFCEEEKAEQDNVLPTPAEHKEKALPEMPETGCTGCCHENGEYPDGYPCNICNRNEALFCDWWRNENDD